MVHLLSQPRNELRYRRRIKAIPVRGPEFETTGLRQSEFCHKRNLALGTLKHGKARDGSRQTACQPYGLLAAY